MLDLLIFIIFSFFICLTLAVFVIAIGVLTITLLKDIQHKAEEDERSGT